MSTQDVSITFDFIVDIPINEWTTKLYSENEELLLGSLNQVLRSIDRIIEKEGFISLERIFRILKVRASMSCPNIFFLELKDYTYGSDLLTLQLLGGYNLEPVFSLEKPEPKQEPKLKLVKNEESGEKEWDSTQTETSESEERDQT